jgi:hypothetical protein
MAIALTLLQEPSCRSNANADPGHKFMQCVLLAYFVEPCANYNAIFCVLEHDIALHAEINVSLPVVCGNCMQ